MRVLHVIDGLGRGGAERMLVDLANVSASDGHEVTVCITGTVATLAADLAPEVHVELLKRRRRVTPIAFARLAAIARDSDVVHAHMRSNAALVAMLRATGLVRTPLVFHDHFGSIERDRSIPRWFSLGKRQVTRYVGVYQQLTDWALAAGMPANRVTTIPNALDLRRLKGGGAYDLRAELGLQPDTCVAVLVASLRRDKGVEVMLEALAQATRRERLHVAIVGGDGEPEYAAEVRARSVSLGLSGHVSFLGSRADVPQILRGADVGLLASHTESGPLVLIEYLAAGLPIVATRVGDIGRRLAAEGVAGFVEANDAKAFARELDAVASLSAAERQARGAAHRELLDAHWDLAAIMPRWYALYAGAIRNRT